MDPRLKRGLRVLTSILFRSPKITKAIDSDNRLGRFVRMGGADRILIWWLRAAETDFLSTFCSPFGIQSPFGWRRFTVSPLRLDLQAPASPFSPCPWAFEKDWLPICVDLGVVQLVLDRYSIDGGQENTCVLNDCVLLFSCLGGWSVLFIEAMQHLTLSLGHFGPLQGTFTVVQRKDRKYLQTHRAKALKGGLRW